MHRRYIASYTLRLQSGISLAINLVDISKMQIGDCRIGIDMVNLSAKKP